MPTKQEKEYMGKDMPWMLIVLVILVALLMFVAMFMALFANGQSTPAPVPSGSDSDSSDSDSEGGDNPPPVVCGPGETNCDGVCVSPDTDPDHCGSCGNACGPSSPACCTGTCVDLDTSLTDCGSCGNDCPMTATCIDGVCTCPMGEILCPVTNTCITNDANACQVCAGQPCPGGMTCQNLTCGCTGGLTNCSNVCVDLKTDEQNCGACTVTCAVGQLCCNGTCSTVNTDPDNCGGCGTICPPIVNGQRTCTAGVCGFLCNPGFDDCTTPGQCLTDLNTDTNNCGTCGNVCLGDCPVCTLGVCFDEC